MVYNFFWRKTSAMRANKFACSDIKNETMSNKVLAEELHEPIISKFKKKAYSSFINNIWVAGLAKMKLINKKDKGFRFLLYVIDIFSKYAWVIPLKDKKGITNTNDFHKILDECNRKPNNIWVSKGSEFYSR